MAQVHHKVQEVEKSVTRQLSKTLASIQELSVRTDKQWVAITQAGAEARQLANKVLALEERLSQLEKGSSRGSGDRKDQGNRRSALPTRAQTRRPCRVGSRNPNSDLGAGGRPAQRPDLPSRGRRNTGPTCPGGKQEPKRHPMRKIAQAVARQHGATRVNSANTTAGLARVLRHVVNRHGGPPVSRRSCLS